MTVYQKDGSGVWQPATMVYVKVNGVWTPAKNAYVKVGGVWQVSHTYDVVPPDPPELGTTIVDNIVGGKLIGRYIRVSVRGGTAHNPELRRIRVLTTYNGATPTNYNGGTYTGLSETNYPDEPWSEWRYNGFGPHSNSSVFANKRWPRNASDTTLVKAGTDYHFAAWAEDFAGNWSPAVTRVVSIPKTVDAANVIVKQTHLQVNSTASANNSGVDDGDLIQRNSPQSWGMWFYGDQITNTIGSQGTPTMKWGQILVSRDADDGGSASANVYLGWHTYRTQAEVPSPGSRLLHNITNVGTIAKGESKWFALPDTHLSGLNTTVKGFGLYYRDAAKATGFANDFSIVKGVSSYLRTGELSLAWEEAL